MKAIQDDFHRHMVENGFDLVRGEPSERSMRMFTSIK
nr:plasmid recombination protein [Bacillus sp. ZHX3]